MFFGRPPDVAALKRARDIPGLTKAMASRNKSISAEAAEALGEIGDASAIDALVEAYRRDDGPHVAAIKALGVFAGDQRALIPLVSGVFDHGPEVRDAAMKCLAWYGDMDAVAGELARRISVSQDTLVTYPYIASQAGWDMLKILAYAREEANRRALGTELLSGLAGADAAQKTIAACEERLQVVYDKSTDLLVAHVLERSHDANLVPGLLAAAEDKSEPEDVRRYAATFKDKLLKKGVKLSDLR